MPGVSRDRQPQEEIAMPWRPEDAPHHTKKADTSELCALWSEVANKTLAETQDEARAVRTANAVIRRVSMEKSGQLEKDAHRRPAR